MNNGDKFQQSKFMPYIDSKGNEFKSDWPQKMNMEKLIEGEPVNPGKTITIENYQIKNENNTNV